MLSAAVLLLMVSLVVSAARFSKPFPQSTLASSVVGVTSPIPTGGVAIRHVELLNRQVPNSDNTCGFDSDNNPVTCENPSAICATNTLAGVHGCCIASNFAQCVLPTTCIPQASLAVLCTDTVCSNDEQITKCTSSDKLSCYTRQFLYQATVMTEYGCTTSSFNEYIPRVVTPQPVTVTERASNNATSPPSPTSSNNPPSNTANVAAAPSTNIGGIVGGSVGGLTVLSAAALGVFFMLRRRQKKKKKKNAKSAHEEFEGKPELAADGVTPDKLVVQADAEREPAEMQAPIHIHELPASVNIHEMPAPVRIHEAST